MFSFADKTDVKSWGEVLPVFAPAVKREEAKIRMVEDSHQCQRAICHISPFFKSTAESISSVLSDQIYQLLEGQLIITSSQVGQLIKIRLRDHPVMFSAPRDKLDRYQRVFAFVSTTMQEVRDPGILERLSKSTECLQ